MQQDSLHIDLALLPIGKHEYDVRMDNAFFEELDQEEILGGDAKAHVVLVQKEHSAALTISIIGTVEATCDRCLDPVTIPVEIEDEVVVKIGVAPEELDENIWLPAEEPVLDLAWLLYEDVELSLPLVICHREGECNPEMQELLRAHAATIADEDEE